MKKACAPDHKPVKSFSILTCCEHAMVTFNFCYFKNYGPVQTPYLSQADQIQWIKFIRNMASESIQNAWFNLDWLSQLIPPA